MIRNRVLLGLVLMVLISGMPYSVNALTADRTLTSVYGYKVAMHIENSDYGVAGKPYVIFMRFTLLEFGEVKEFIKFDLVLRFETEVIYLSHFGLINPWSAEGDHIDLVGKVTVDPAHINFSGIELYETRYYIKFSITVRLQNNDVKTQYTDWIGPNHASVSTMSLMAIWPWPPIIIMTSLYWIGLLIVRRFNKRYKGLTPPPEQIIRTVNHSAEPKT